MLFLHPSKDDIACASGAEGTWFALPLPVSPPRGRSSESLPREGAQQN